MLHRDRHVSVGYGFLRTERISLLCERLASVILCFSMAIGVAEAQIPPGSLQDIQNSLRNNTGSDGTANEQLGGIQVYQPVTPPRSSEPPSRLEELYSERAGVQLRQFGYETVGVPMPVQVAAAGAIQDSYVLGSGDQIVLVLRGQENATYRQSVSRDGQVVFPKLNPVQAAGRNFGDFRADLEARVGQAFISTDAFVTLGSVRQVSVIVAGEVRTPGARILSSLSSPLDAILLSGGVKKTGSLRNIRIENGGRVRVVDLYVALTGVSGTMGSLRDGDHIYVPPVANTVAVSGGVRRPGIYELPAGQHSIPSTRLIELAGGVEPASYELSKTRVMTDGGTEVVSLTRGGGVDSGEILFVNVARNVLTGRVSLRGALRTEGVRSRTAVSSAAQLISGVENLSPDAYPMFAAIVRRDVRSNARVLVPFSVDGVLSGRANVPLQDNDTVFVFRFDEVRLLAKAASGAELTRKEIGCPTSIDEATRGASEQPALHPNIVCRQSTEQIADASASRQNNQNNTSRFFTQQQLQGGAVGVRQLSEASGTAVGLPRSAPSVTEASNADFPDNDNETPRLSQSPEPGTIYRASYPTPSIRGIAQTLGVTPEALVSAAKDHLIWVADAVRDPGPYLTGEGSALASIIQAAGGLQSQADLSWVEVTSNQVDVSSGTSRTQRTAYKGTQSDFVRVAVRPLDVIRLRQVFSDSDQGRILVSGEVRYPGTFDIIRGEKLSSILERAGGLTDQAYPYGAVFLRKRAAVQEKEAREREAAQLEAQLATLLSTPGQNSENTASQVSYVSSLAGRLREQPALGRIMVTADPAVLHTQPELDIVVEPGDTLVIPKRPTTITVAGEVLNPGSFQYRNEFSLDDYVNLSGGAAQGADEGRTFIILPDGSARPARESWIAFDNADKLPPGSTIVVPRDLRPFDWMTFVRDITSITGQLAVTAASVAVIGR